MTGTIFVLAINIAIATTMAIAFFAVGHFDIRNRAANWFGLAFVLAASSFAAEYVLHAGLSDGPARLFIALSMLGCFLMIGHGLTRRYEIGIPLAALAAIFLGAALVYWLILDMPRNDLWRQVLYQAPYWIVTHMGVYVVWRSGRRGALDIILMAVLTLTALSFALKPALAAMTGGVGADGQAYATTLYALISQASGAVAALLLAMTCLALIVSDSVTAIVRQAQRDSLTGLLNQSGFEHHGARLVSASSREASHHSALLLIAIETADPGTPAEAIRGGFANALAGIFGPDALIARLSGLNFAVIMPQANLFGARRQAEMLRVRLAAGTLPIAGAAKASIGIAEQEAGDSLSDMLARAEWALEEARRAGGNCVRLAARSALATARGTG